MICNEDVTITWSDGSVHTYYRSTGGYFYNERGRVSRIEYEAAKTHPSAVITSWPSGETRRANDGD